MLNIKLGLRELPENHAQSKAQNLTNMSEV